jgi:hypothetical protein
MENGTNTDEFRTGGNEEMWGGAKPAPELMVQYTFSHL